MEIEEPRDLAYEDVKDYEKLTKDRISPLYGKEYRDIFMLAMAIGYLHAKPTQLKKRIPNIPLRGFSSQEKWLMRAIAIAKERKLEVLFEPKNIFYLAEEYANAGIKILVSEVFDNLGTYDKILEADLRKLIKEDSKSDIEKNELG